MFWNVFAIYSKLNIQILFLLVYSTCTLVLKNYMVLTFLYYIWFVQNSCSTNFVYVYVYRSHRNIYCLKKYTIPNFNPFPITVTIFTSIESRKSGKKLTENAWVGPEKVSRDLYAVLVRVVLPFHICLYNNKRKFDSQISREWLTLVNDNLRMKTEHCFLSGSFHLFEWLRIFRHIFATLIQLVIVALNSENHCPSTWHDIKEILKYCNIDLLPRILIVWKCLIQNTEQF